MPRLANQDRDSPVAPYASLRWTLSLNIHKMLQSDFKKNIDAKLDFLLNMQWQ